MRKCDSCGCVVGDKKLVSGPSGRYTCKNVEKCAVQRDTRIRRETDDRNYELEMADLIHWNDNFNPNNTSRKR